MSTSVAATAVVKREDLDVLVVGDADVEVVGEGVVGGWGAPVTARALRLGEAARATQVARGWARSLLFPVRDPRWVPGRMGEVGAWPGVLARFEGDELHLVLWPRWEGLPAEGARFSALVLSCVMCFCAGVLGDDIDLTSAEVDLDEEVDLNEEGSVDLNEEGGVDMGAEEESVGAGEEGSVDLNADEESVDLNADEESVDFGPMCDE